MLQASHAAVCVHVNTVSCGSSNEVVEILFTANRNAYILDKQKNGIPAVMRDTRKVIVGIIVDAIRGVMAGEVVMSDEIRHTIENISAMPEMSPRQTEILNLVAKGFSNKEIAERLKLQPGTIKNMISMMLNKTFCVSRADLSRYAIEHHLVKSNT